VPVTGIDHVQLAPPEGCEAAAREFFGGLGKRAPNPSQVVPVLRV